MTKWRNMCLAMALVLVSIAFGAAAEENPFDGAQWYTELMTGGATPAANTTGTAAPEATPAPGLTDQSQTPVVTPQADETEPPSKATYRYLKCWPATGVPLYYDSTTSKVNTSFTEGTLVLVHEYANGRARVTFGGWEGWVDTKYLSTKDPNSGGTVGYRYAYDESGSVPLYRYGFEYAIAYVPNGAKVAITDMKENGYTYVMYGAVSGWAKNSSLQSKLPEGVQGQEGSSYYYRALVADTPGGQVQLYSSSACEERFRCGTVPDGTVVKVLNTQLHVKISYGGTEYWVKPKNVFQEISEGSSSIDTGITAPMPELEPVPEEEPDDADEPAAEGEESPVKKGGSSRSSTSRSAEAQPRVSVEIEYLGLIQSCTRDAAGERMVTTAELEFETDAPANKRIAYIYAPSTGKCSLWKKASKNSDLIKKCKAGTVVMVLEYGSKFCRIRYDGKEGYVLTSCLRFPGAGVTAIGTGRISYKGKTNGSTTVNIRGAGNSDAHKIAEWRTGTQVTVFSHKNGWYEVEYRGVHGWVQDKYLTMDD